MIKIIGAICFLLSFFILSGMNRLTDTIRQHYAKFEALDMKFHYLPKELLLSLENMGNTGRQAYFNIMLLDFLFILCFYFVMAALSNVFIQTGHFKTVLTGFAILRGAFDLIENIIIIFLIKQYQVQNVGLATICSWATTFKFIFLILWLLCAIIAVFLTFTQE